MEVAFEPLTVIDVTYACAVTAGRASKTKASISRGLEGLVAVEGTVGVGGKV
jgi:hypothetical protein